VLAGKHPLGAGGELYPALEIARARGARLVVGLRDILDDATEAAREWQAADLFGCVERYYDRVLVYGQRDIADPVRECDFPRATARMTHFCGYVFRPQPLAARTDATDAAGRGRRRRRRGRLLTVSDVHRGRGRAAVGRVRRDRPALRRGAGAAAA